MLDDSVSISVSRPRFVHSSTRRRARPKPRTIPPLGLRPAVPEGVHDVWKMGAEIGCKKCGAKPNNISRNKWIDGKSGEQLQVWKIVKHVTPGDPPPPARDAGGGGR